MAQEPISGFQTSLPNGQIEFVATDPLNTSSAPTGTTFKYIFTDIINYIMTSFGLHAYEAALAATTANLSATYNNGASGVGATLTNNGSMVPLVIDNITLSIADRVLIKDQSTQYQNGIYVVTNAGSNVSNWVLTRSSDFDVPSQIFYNGIIIVNQGTVNGGLMYQQTQSGPFTIGVTAIIFAQFSDIGSMGIIPLNRGGTNANLTASNGGIFYSTTTAGAILPGTSVSSCMLQSGSSAAPAWSLSAWPSTTTQNQLLYSSSNNIVGGLATGASASLITDAAGVPSMSAPLMDGQLIVGATGGTPQPATISAGNGISIVNGPNSITFESNGGSNSWIIVSNPSEAMATNLGFTVDNGSTLVTFTTPAVCAVGDWIEINGSSSGGWSLIPNGGQTLIGNGAPVSTSISSSNRYDSVRLRCIVTNTIWSVVSSNGTLVYV